MESNNQFNRYLSTIDVWALSLGCIIGWGAFVMPGTTFLPVAGPAGTVIAMLLSAVIMLVIAANYAYLMKKQPGIASMILEQAGAAVDKAENGQIAVDKISASAPGDYDLVLMDIQMPVMDGYAAAKAIRALKDPALAAIPIIALTANAFTEDIRTAKESGMNGHIAKPIDINVMIKTITDVLSRR